MKRDWMPSLNTFEINTRGSHKKAIILFTDSVSKLKNEISDPTIAALFADIEPTFRQYEQLYQDKQLVDNTYESKTMGFEGILTRLSTEIKRWEGKVRGEFPEDTVEEHSIFPNKRTPFIAGTYENRRASVGVLATKLQEFPIFQVLSMEVRAFYNEMEQLRDTQQQMEGKSAQLSDLLEAARVEMCEELYGALGVLMHKHRKTPSNISRYFDLSLLRKTNNSQDAETADVTIKNINAGAVISLGKRPADATEIYLKNTGSGLLQFSCADFEGVMDNVTYTLSAGETFADTYENLFLSDKTYFLVRNIGAEAGSLTFKFNENTDSLEE